MKALLLTLALIISSPLGRAADAPPAAATQLTNALLTAIAENDFAGFTKDGNKAFQEGMTKQAFESVSRQLSPILKAGYQTQFLTELKRTGVEIFLWKLTPKTGADEFVAKLVLEDGKVAGFWIN